MNTEIEIFSSSEFGEVRTVCSDLGPMFCLSDVCRAMDIKDPTSVKRRLKQDGMQMLDSQDPLIKRTSENQEVTGIRLLTFIDEPNLYRIIFSSRKDSAIRFQDWVFSEVIPSIRKHGFYIPDKQLVIKNIPIAAYLEDVTEQKDDNVRKKNYPDGYEAVRNLLIENGYKHITSNKVFNRLEQLGLIESKRVCIQKEVEIKFLSEQFIEDGYGINRISNNAENNQILLNKDRFLDLLNMIGINLANEEFMAKHL